MLSFHTNKSTTSEDSMTIANVNDKDLTPAQRAISIMRPPRDMSLICIDITNRCNLSCSNCTRLLENQSEFWDMSLPNFRLAVKSLTEFPGIVAILGGNPCMHRNFEEICKIFVEEFPDKDRRGLWSNNVFKHEDLVLETFGTFNLNPHGAPKGIENLSSLYKKSGGKGVLWEEQSLHSPLLVAIKDFYGEKEMWARISQCDVNRFWSASIIENKGNLRAYFCEVAASFDLAKGTDFGIDVTFNWWKRPMADFSAQVINFCPGCGAAARIKPTVDSDETDTYSISNRDLVRESESKGRNLLFIEGLKDLEENQSGRSLTEYNQAHLESKSFGIKARRALSKFLHLAIGRKKVVKLRAIVTFVSKRTP